MIKLKKPRSQMAKVLHDLIIYGSTNHRNYPFNYGSKISTLISKGIDIKKRKVVNNGHYYVEAFIDPFYTNIAIIMYQVINHDTHKKYEKKIQSRNSKRTP
jgi:hypothetical protein